MPSSTKRIFSICLTIIPVVITACSGGGAGREAPANSGGWATKTTQISVAQDAYVSSINATTNYGTAAELMVDRTSSEVYLKFSLANIPQGSIIKSAELSMTAYGGFAYGGDGNVYVSLVNDDSWSETAINWNNKPASLADPLGYWWLWYDATPSDKIGRLKNNTLLSTIQNEVDGNRIVSFRLNSPGYATNYRSREFTSPEQRPQLIVTYLEPPSVSLTAVADAYVEQNTPDANFETSQELKVNQIYNNTFVKFDLSSIPTDVLVTSVYFEMTSFGGYAYGGDGNVYTRFVSDDSWDESQITWTNAPAASAQYYGYWWLWYGVSDSSVHTGVNYSDALAGLVDAEYKGDQMLSLRLDSPGYYTLYHSREWTNAGERPRMKVYYIKAN